MGKFIDLTGQRFGKLTVISFAYIKNKQTYWNCVCDCGNNCTIMGSHLKDGHTTSCGCYHKKIFSNIVKKMGLSHKRIGNIYYSMIERCYNQNCTNYKDYGGRNIKVCYEWKNESNTFFIWALKNGYSDKLTIDRIDVNGNYCPENCRWVCIKTQARNKRNNFMITYNGKTQCLSAWCEELSIPYAKTFKRISYYNWSIERAFTTP